MLAKRGKESNEKFDLFWLMKSTGAPTVENAPAKRNLEFLYRKSPEACRINAE